MDEREPRFPLEEAAASQAGERPPALTGEGRLQIRATTASEALPVSDAAVVITDRRRDGELGTLLYSARTDRSGLTPEFTLAAPPASEGETPGGVPFQEYEVYVSADRFRPIHFLGVPVFDGVTTVQPAALTPDLGGGTGPASTVEVPAYTSQL